MSNLDRNISVITVTYNNDKVRIVEGTDGKYYVFITDLYEAACNTKNISSVDYRLYMKLGDIINFKDKDYYNDPVLCQHGIFKQDNYIEEFHYLIDIAYLSVTVLDGLYDIKDAYYFQSWVAYQVLAAFNLLHDMK